ncbi:hypothetical protein MXB_3301 [Myxobolus squamalis]|nr:hypothetical protein MXB_3301 [Myxobolus squamalis]
MFTKYTPLLYDTLQLFLALGNLDQVDSLLSSSTHFFIPFESTKACGCPLFTNFIDPTLKNLQLYRLKREAGDRHNLGWFIFNDKQNIIKTHPKNSLMFLMANTSL